MVTGGSELTQTKTAVVFPQNLVDFIYVEAVGVFKVSNMVLVAT